MLLKSNFNSPTLATFTANIIEANNLVNIFIRNCIYITIFVQLSEFLLAKQFI